jgi:hypothetical protein
MSRPSVRSDGELEGAMYHGIASATAPSQTAHGRDHGQKTSTPKVWPSFFSAEKASPPTRFNTSLRPVPEVYPLVAVVCAGLAFVGMIAWHDLTKNHEVLIRKHQRSVRKLGVVNKQDDPELFAKVTRQAKNAYDNPLRRYVLGKKPDLFPWLLDTPEKDPTVNLSKEKWKRSAEDGAREKK